MRCLKLLLLGGLMLWAVVGVGGCFRQWRADAALSDAAFHKDLTRAEALLQRGKVSAEGKSTAIWYAAKQDNLPMFRLLLAYGAPLDATTAHNRWTLLDDAIWACDLEMVKLLMERGVHCCEGETPLTAAAERQSIPIVTYLLARGEDVNAPNGAGEPPLGFAVEHDNRALVHLLLRHGARTDVRDYAGRSMFALAKHQGDAALARELQAKGSPE